MNEPLPAHFEPLPERVYAAWSPDGKFVGFTRAEFGMPPAWYVVRTVQPVEVEVK